MKSKYLLTCDDLDDLLSANHFPMSFSELHGLLSGLLSAGFDAGTPWIQYIKTAIDDDNYVFSNELLEVFEELKQQTHASISDNSFSFEIMLPEDNHPLSERLLALSQWCQGFLLGYGLIIGDSPIHNKEVDEALQDMVALSQVDIETEETESAEQDFVTISEHVRVAAQVIMFETKVMQKGRTPEKKQNSPEGLFSSKTIH